MVNLKANGFVSLGWRFLSRIESLGEIEDVSWTHPRGISVQVASPKNRQKLYSVILQRLPSTDAAMVVNLHIGSVSVPIKSPHDLETLPLLSSPSAFWNAITANAA